MSKIKNEAMLRQAGEDWPGVFIARADILKLTGGMISAHTVRNRDSLGTGPEGKFMLGKKVGYPVNTLIDWLITNYLK